MAIRDLLDNRNSSNGHQENYDYNFKKAGYFRRFCGQLVIACLIFGCVVYCYDQQNKIGEGVRFVVAMATAQDEDFLAVSGKVMPDLEAMPAENGIVSEQKGVKNSQGKLMMILPTSGLMEKSFGEVGDDGLTDDGITILCQNTEPIKAAAGGTVTEVVAKDGLVNLTIKHDTILFTRYGGITEAKVKLGEVVRQGQIIGEIKVDPQKGAGLQFSVYENDLAVDPFLYLNGPE